MTKRISLRVEANEITFKATSFQTVAGLSTIFVKFCDIWGFEEYLYGAKDVKGWMRTKRTLKEVKAILERHGFEVSLG